MSMTLDATVLPQLLEGVMLACFGLAWPVNLLQMLRQRRAVGKSLMFTLIVWTGYLAGTGAKLVSSELAHTPLPPVFWLYVLNSVTVGINAWLYWRFDIASRARCAVPAAVSTSLAG